MLKTNKKIYNKHLKKHVWNSELKSNRQLNYKEKIVKKVNYLKICVKYDKLFC
jgi:hypothetical protein